MPTVPSFSGPEPKLTDVSRIVSYRIEARLIKLKIEEQKFPRHRREWRKLVEQSKPLTERSAVFLL